MVVYKIWSRAIDRTTIDRTTGMVKASRTEYVDTEKNELFSPTDNKEIVKAKYASFWNLSAQEDKVLVDKVVRAHIKSQGDNWGIIIRDRQGVHKFG